MTRFLLHTLTALSLLLLVTSLGLWPFLLFRGGELFARLPIKTLAMGPTADYSSLGFRIVQPLDAVRPWPPPPASLPFPPLNMTGNFTFTTQPYYSGCLGFYIVRSMEGNVEFLPDKIRTRGSATTSLIVPYWLPPAMAAVLPTLWLIRRRRQRLDNLAGLCPTCRYDLRAHQPILNSELRIPNSQLPPRCPECGTPISHAHPVPKDSVS